MARNGLQYDVRSTHDGSTIDAGQRSYMLGVYNYMAGGVALTGVVAFALFSFLTTQDPSLSASKLRNGACLDLRRALALSEFCQHVPIPAVAFRRPRIASGSRPVRVDPAAFRCLEAGRVLINIFCGSVSSLSQVVADFHATNANVHARQLASTPADGRLRMHLQRLIALRQG
jgi:hypothetical protein